jgi:hypothetical protein
MGYGMWEQERNGGNSIVVGLSTWMNVDLLKRNGVDLGRHKYGELNLKKKKSHLGTLG